ncbi:GNAT family N-acetyltransferase [Amycolatopsis sp. NPDC059027]|uniref:GNAT family N-acetyltransferase n=1 Tax=unclassified Amycolatopsis TaxID=2618356 RepID=UPI0036731682
MDGELGDPGPVTPVRLTVADAGELLTLQRAAYLDEVRIYRDVDLPPVRDTLEDTRAALADPASTTWGVRDDGRLIASIRAVVDGVECRLYRLVVAPDRQGEGLGSALLLAAEVAAPPEVTTFRLNTGSKSGGPLYLYPRLGYRETHRTPENDHELVHFAKPRA